MDKWEGFGGVLMVGRYMRMDVWEGAGLYKWIGRNMNLWRGRQMGGVWMGKKMQVVYGWLGRCRVV